MDLGNQKCIPCHGGEPILTKEEIKRYLPEIDSGWGFKEDPDRIVKVFVFKDFKESLVFINKVGKLAEEEGHHPNIHIDYNKVKLVLWTHKIGGLHANDFILASKIDMID